MAEYLDVANDALNDLGTIEACKRPASIGQPFAAGAEIEAMAKRIADLRLDHARQRRALAIAEDSLRTLQQQQTLLGSVDYSALESAKKTVVDATTTLGEIDTHVLGSYQEIRRLCEVAYRARRESLEREERRAVDALSLIRRKAERFSNAIPNAEAFAQRAIDLALSAHDPEWRSVAEVADMLGVSERAIYLRIRQGVGTRKDGRHVCVRASEVYRHFNEFGRRPAGLRVPSTNPPASMAVALA